MPEKLPALPTRHLHRNLRERRHMTVAEMVKDINRAAIYTWRPISKRRVYRHLTRALWSR